MVIYHCIERIWTIIVTPNFLYNIYDHEKYYPGEPFNIHINHEQILSIRTIGKLPQNIVNLPLPFFGRNESIVLSDNIF